MAIVVSQSVSNSCCSVVAVVVVFKYRMMIAAFVCLLLLVVVGYVNGFARGSLRHISARLYCIDKMTIDELKSELDVRNVKYDDCFSKTELVQRLKDSRLSGKADPSIIDKFNTLEIDDSILNDDEVMNQVKAQDGSLVGGLTPEQLKKLRLVY